MGWVPHNITNKAVGRPNFDAIRVRRLADVRVDVVSDQFFLEVFLLEKWK
jgi:hypothetical protein